jgi:hypothetical protein
MGTLITLRSNRLRQDPRCRRASSDLSQPKDLSAIDRSAADYSLSTHLDEEKEALCSAASGRF